MDVSANESWLHPSVVGDHVEFTSDPNTGETQRDGVIFISLDGGPTLPFGVSQSPVSQPCGLNFSAEQAGLPTTGGSAGFDVITPSSCTWQYQSDAAWLTLGASGGLTGSQNVTFNAPSTLVTRTARISVSDGTTTGEFNITQYGPATISGRVLTSGGRGVTNAMVTLTDTQGLIRQVITGRFGTYQCSNVTAGQIYTVAATSRRFSFAPRFVNITDNLTNLDLVASP